MGSSIMHLRVFQDPPTFRVRPRPEYLQEVGRELTIPCEAIGDPTPNVTWSKVGTCCFSLENAAAHIYSMIYFFY